jgi:CMP-N-acetylneuraminic acid synthetase
MNDIVIFMPMRLNSQRIKHKNIINVFGRPMFCWSLETLDKLNLPIYIYTSDIKIFKEHLDFIPKNINFIERPKILDNNDICGYLIYKEFSNIINSSAYMLTHCTSPFVKLETYERIINAVLIDGYDSSCTVEKKQTFCWYKNNKINFSMPRIKTQDLEPIFIETSAAYCFKKEVLNLGCRTGSNICFIETSGIENFDIDNKSDLEIFSIMKNKNDY